MSGIKRKRRKADLGLMALEPRWMFDGAAAHAALDPSARTLIPTIPAPVEVRAANPALDGGKLEVMFIDTSLANYKTLEAAVKPGVEIEEIAGRQSGLAQMAVWAETHSGYDSISVISPGAEATLGVGTDTLTDAGLANPTTRAELAEIGTALKAGGDLMLYGSDVAAGADGQQFINDLAAATGAVVAASDAPIGLAGNWSLDQSTRTVDATAFVAPAYGDDLYIAPTEIQAADPALDGGKTEVVFVDTAVSGYQTLEADVGPGIEIVEIGGGKSGLEQMTVWAETHSGYDSLTLLSHGSEAQINVGTDTVTDASLSTATVQAELAVIGAALKPGGDVLLYGCDVAEGSDGQRFVTDVAADTGAVVAASTHVVGVDGGWTLDYGTGAITATEFSAPDFSGDLDTPFSVSGGTLTVGYSTTTITGDQTVQGGGKYEVTAITSLPAGYSLYAGSDQVTGGGYVIPDGGTWTLHIPTGLSAGTYTVQYTVKSILSSSSDYNTVFDESFSFTVAAPASTQLTTPSVSTSGLHTSAVGAITGTSSGTDAGATITVYNNGNAIGTTTAASDGSWSLGTYLGSGSYSITASASESGNYTASGTSSAASILVDSGPAFTNATSETINASSPFALTATVSDPVTSSITYSVVSNASHGNATINSSTGVMSYTLSPSSYLGADSFVIKATDSYGVSTTETISILSDNPPVVTTTNPGTTYIVGQSAQVVDTAMTVTDADASTSVGGLGGGSLVAGITSGGDAANDVLSVAAMTLANSHVIAVSGSTITDNGVTIGTESGGSNGSALHITLSSGDTNSQVTDLARAITFSGGNTSSSAARAVAFNVTDGLGVSASASDTVHAILGPTIYSASYNPATGRLTLTGGDFTTSAGDYTLSGQTLTGEGSGSYSLGNGDAIVGTPTTTSVTIQIASANQATVDGLWDAAGTTAPGNGHAFNINAAANWDESGGTHAPAAATNAVTVASTGTPTLTDNNPSIPATPYTAVTAQNVDNSAITVTDSPDFSGTGVWDRGNLTVSFGATSHDASHDELLITPGGGITLSNGMTAGSTVSYNGTVVGAIASGATGTPGQSLTVTFTGAATDASIQALVGTIQFADLGGSTPTAGTRSINFTLTDAYSRSSAVLSDSVMVFAPPTISGASYDPNTGLLTLSGNYFTANPTNYTLSDLTIRGENGGTYTLNASDMISSATSTSVVIQIAAANQPAVDALLDKNGTTSAVYGTTFNLAATAGWDTSGNITEVAAATNALTVTSSGTPSMTHSGAQTIYDTNTNSNPGTVDGSTVTVADLSMVTAWNTGNLTATVGGAVHDTNNDQLTVGDIGLITCANMNAGTAIYYNGTAIGTIASGATGSPNQNLTVTLNANASNAAIEALVNAIQFSDAGATVTGNRTVSFTVTDAYGGTSAAISDTVTVVPTPTITGTGEVSGGWISPTGLPTTTTVPYPALAAGPNNTVYAAEAVTGGVEVFQLNGSAWSAVGSVLPLTPDTSASKGVFLSVAPDGSVYLAVNGGTWPNDTLTLEKYSGGSWSVVGGSAYSLGNSSWVTGLAIAPNGTPYISADYYYTPTQNESAEVLDYTSGAWQQVGSLYIPVPGSLFDSEITIASDGTPYLIVHQPTIGIGVYEYNGSGWNSLGIISSSYDYGQQLYIAGAPTGGGIYVEYVDGSDYLHVQKYTSAGGWSNLGDPDSVTESEYVEGLAISSDGTLYSSFDPNYGYGNLVVSTYSNNSWTVNTNVIDSGSQSSPVTEIRNGWSVISSSGQFYLAVSIVSNASGGWQESIDVFTYAASGVSYDPNTADLTITGTNFTPNAGDFTLADFTVTGEGSLSYTLGGDDGIVSNSSTQLVVHIAADHQAAMDGVLDTAGVNALVSSSNYFNLSAARGWDSSGGIIAPAETINTIVVTSTGTPSLADSHPIAPADSASSSTADQIDGSAITVTDQPDLSASGMWAGGNLTVSFGSTNHDSGNDELLVGNAGLITVSGGTVSYNGNAIGTASGGTPGSNLVVTFSGAHVTDSAVEALVNAIQFEDSGATGTTGNRTVNFVLTDAYNRASNTLADTVHVVTGPTISGATYNPFTGILTIVGGDFVGSSASNVTLGDLSITGESGAGTFTLSGADASVASVGSSAVVIQVAQASQQTLNAILDKSGISSATSATAFNLNAAYGWNASGGTSAPAAATNAITVASTGTPTVTHVATTTTDSNYQSAADTVDTSAITVGDVDSGAGAYFTGAVGVWNHGSLTATVSGSAYDSAHDQLGIGAIGGITVSGTNVLYNGNQIGTVTSGSATGTPGVPLTVTLSGQYATNAAVAALASAIQFSDSGETLSAGNRTVTLTLADAYGRTNTITDTVTVLGVPQITATAYNPATGILTLSGNFLTTTASNYTLSDLTLSGEGSGTYQLGNGDAISGTPTASSVAIQIASANQAAVDALFDKSGTTALVSTSHSFNLAAAAGWDANGTVSAFAQTTNTVTVASTGTPTLSDSAHTTPSDTTSGSTAKVVDASTITVSDGPDLSGAGMWAGGNLTVSFGATNHDASHDQLTIGSVGPITVSGVTVSYNGTVIGTIAGGTPGTNLVITFSGGAVSDAAIEALVNAVQFSDTATTTPGTRTIKFVATDSYGRSTATMSDILFVTQDTPPSILSGSGTQSLTTGMNDPISLSSYLAVSDTDAGQVETWSTLGAPTNGTVTYSHTTAASGSSAISAPTITYTPNASFIGSDSFTIEINDGQGGYTTKTFSITVIAPVVESITRASGAAAVTNSSTESFTVTFNEAVSGLTAANFALSGTDGTGTIGTPTTANGGLTWTVPVTGVSGNGTLGLNLGSNLSSIQDTFSQSPAAGFTDTASLYTIDTTAPVIETVTLNAASYALGSTVTATITTDPWDGNGAYTMAGTIDGATLTGWSYNTTTHTGTASFTVTTALADVLSGAVPVSIVVTDAAGNVSTAYTSGITNTVIDSHAPTAIALSNTVAPLYADGVVGTLSTTDASTGTETFAYAITGGASASKFQIVGNTLEVADATTLTHGASYAINVQVTDAGGNTHTQAFTLTGANGPAVSAGGTLTINERSAAAAIDTVTINDATGLGTMTGATVTISSGFTSGDVLGFTNQSGITGSYNSGTGMLTLTGTATIAQYQAALRSVTYADPTLDETATTTRTVTWAATDADGTGTTATSTVTVAYVNAPPTLTLTSEANAGIDTASGASAGTVLFSGAASSAIEAGQSITGITLGVTGLADGSSEQLEVGGTWVSLTSGASGTTANGIAYSVGAISAGATTVTLSKTDTAANWNSDIDAIEYRDSAAGSSTAGARTITLTAISDSGGIANGGSNTTTLADHATVTLTANDTPVVTVPGAQTIDTTTANAITGLAVADGITGSTVTAMISALAGDLHVTGSGVSGNGTGSVTITESSVAALNTVLATLTYTTTLTTSGTDTITVSVDDNGTSFIGGAKTGTGTIAVSVTNGTPVVTVPATISDSLAGFDSIGGVSVAESLAGSAVTATLTDAHGAIEVTAGAATVTGNDSNDLTITGSLSAINAALASLQYQTNLSASGLDAIVINVVDGTKSGNASLDINVVANDIPVVNVAAAQSYTTTAYHAISGVSVTDTLGAASVTATVSAGAGDLLVTAGSGTTVTGNGGGSLTITGSEAGVNAALASLQYATTATATGSDTITVSYNDNGGALVGGAHSASATIGITLTGNAAPAVTTPATETIETTNSTAISGLAVTDPSGGGASYTATISDGGGDLAVTQGGGGAIISNSGTNSVTVTGTLAAINDALSTLHYSATATTTGSDTITVAVDDNGANANLIGGSKTGSASVAVTLIGNDTPVVTVPGIQTITSNTANGISGISVADTLEGSTVTATITAQHGDLAATGSGVSGNGTGTLTITESSVAALNTVLATLTYTTTATATGADTISVSVNDNDTSGIGGAKTGTACISVNLIGDDTPVVTVPGAQNITDLNVHALTGIGVADPTAGAIVSVTVSDSVGTLTDGAAGVSGSGTGTLTITGSLATVNTALAAVNYAAANDGGGNASADVVTVAVTSDGDTTGIGGAKSGANPIAITLIDNDQPVVATPGQMTISDTGTYAITGVSVSDSLAGTSYVATVSDSSGTVSITGAPSISDGGTASVTVNSATSLTVTASTLADLNATLANLHYAAGSSVTTTSGDVVTVSVDDTGSTNALIGGDKTGSGTINVTLLGNAAPDVSVPGVQTITTSAANAISGVSISDSYDGATYTATISDSHGGLALTQGAGLATISGDNTGSVTVTGSRDDVNDALATLTYTTSLTATGADTITLAVNDGNSTAIGGAMATTRAIEVDVIGNSAPVVSVATAQTIQDTSLHALTGVSISDADVGSSVTATVSALHGTLDITQGGGTATIAANDTGTVTVTGSLANVNDALATLEYATTATATNSDAVTVSVDDNATTLVGGASTSSATTAITVIGNDTPAVGVAGSQSFDDGNAHAITGISVADSLGATTYTATLSDSGGHLAVAQGGGSATITGSGGTTVTVTGCMAAINDALATLAYTATTSGADTITVAVDDNGSSAALVGGDKTGSSTIAVTLVGNDTPALTTPATQTISDTSAHAIGGVSVADVTSGPTLTATVTAPHGDLTFTGSGVTGNGTGSVTITETSVAALNTVLGTLTYVTTGTASVSDTITVSVDDHGAASNLLGGDKTGTASFTATLVGNDVPAVAVPGVQTISDLSQHSISSISVSDTYTGASVTATVSDLHGDLAVTGGSANVTGNNSGSVTITGSLANVDAALATLKYTSTLTIPGSDTITVTLDDNDTVGIGGAKTGSATIAVIPTPTITGPAGGGTVSTTTPTVSGTAEPGSTVKVYDGGTLVGTTTASASGAWSLTTSALGGGTQSLTTTETNSSGVTSAASAATSITVDGSALSAPTTSPTSVLTGSNVTFSGGGGIPGATVDVMDNGTVVGTATVGASGTWTFTTTLPTGGDAITVKQVDANGDVGPISAPLAMTAYAVTAPVITGPASGGIVDTNTPTISGTAQAGSVVKVYDGGTLVGTTTASASGAWSLTTSALANGANTLTTTATNPENVTSLPSGGTAITVAGNALAAPTTATNSVLAGNPVPLSGGGAIPGATIDVMDNGSVIGTATVGANGTWSFTTPLPAGADSITVQQVDSNGDHGPVSAPLAITAYSVAAPTITGPTGGGTVGSDTPTVSGTAQPGSVVKIYDGSTLVGTTTASASGAWSLTTSALANGANTLTATATNPENVTSLASGGTAITVQGNPLPIPSAGGPVVSTTLVPFSGTGGIPGATIDVMDNGLVIGHTTVTANGTWTLTETLEPGVHQITIQQIDANGDAGPISAVMPLTVQLPPPPPLPVPVVTAVPAPAPAPVVEAPVAPVTVIAPVVADTSANFTQGGQGNAPKAAVVTTGGGFQVEVAAPPINAVADGSLFVAKGIPSQIVDSNVISFTVPVDAFGHTTADAGIQLAAKLTSGQPLPSWVSFDSVHGTFVGEAPAGFTGALSVVVVARDSGGHEVSTTFKIQVGGGTAVKEGAPIPAKPVPGQRSGDARPVHSGKLAFTQQLKLAARNAAIRYM